MSSFIKLPVAYRINNYLRLDALPSVVMKPTSSGLGLQLAGGEMFLLGGASDGEAVEELKSNQRAIIRLGIIQPYKFHITVQENYALMNYGTVQTARLIEPGDEMMLAVILDSKKAFNFKDIDWTVRIYLRE